jgi:hypothetical protein
VPFATRVRLSIPPPPTREADLIAIRFSARAGNPFHHLQGRPVLPNHQLPINQLPTYEGAWS